MSVLAGLLVPFAVAHSLGGQPTTAGNRLLARRDAARLLSLVVVPPGATRLGGRRRAWRVPRSLSSAIAFGRSHPPRGSRWTSEASGGGPQTRPNDELTFSFPSLPGRLSSRELTVSLVELPDGSTRLAATAHDVAIVTRPASETVPAGVRKIDVRVASKPATRVTARARVRRIARWFDALPVAQPGGTYACPFIRSDSPTVVLEFRGAHGALLARARMLDAFRGVSSPCNPVRFSSGGNRQTPLIGGRFLLRVERLIGTKLG